MTTTPVCGISIYFDDSLSWYILKVTCECCQGSLVGCHLCGPGRYTVYHGKITNNTVVLFWNCELCTKRQAKTPCKKSSYLLVNSFVKVFGLRHPTPHGEQALRHEPRGVRLRHAQHLPWHHLHLYLLPPNLWQKGWVIHLSTQRQEMCYYFCLVLQCNNLPIFAWIDSALLHCTFAWLHVNLPESVLAQIVCQPFLTSWALTRVKVHTQTDSKPSCMRWRWLSMMFVHNKHEVNCDFVSSVASTLFKSYMINPRIMHDTSNSSSSSCAT